MAAGWTTEVNPLWSEQGLEEAAIQQARPRDLPRVRSDGAFDLRRNGPARPEKDLEAGRKWLG